MKTKLRNIAANLSKWGIVFPALVLVCCSLLTGQAQGVAKTWDGGCGADTSWSCANNWNDNVAPVAADTLTFNGTSTNNSTVDASFGGTIASVTISAGYTGTITMARSLTISGNYSQAAGNFTAANQTLDMNGTFTLSAGNFTASSGTTTLASTMNITGAPGFSHNSGTWTFDGSTTATLTCTGVSFFKVRFAHTSGTKTIGSTCTFPLESGIAVSNAITVNGALTGSGTLTMTAGLLTFSGAGASISGFTAVVANGGMTLSSAANINMSAYTQVDINGAFTLTDASGSTFGAPATAGAFTVSGNLATNTGNTFTPNGGDVTLDGGTGAVTCTGSPFNKVIISLGTKTINSGCTVALGASPTIVSSVVVNGTLAGSGTATFNAALTIASASPLSGFTGLTVTGAFTQNSGITNISTYTLADFNSTFTVSAGSFVAPADMSIASNITTASGTFTHSSGIVRLDGTSGTITCNGAPFNLISLENTSSGKTVAAGCTIPLGTDVSIAKTLTVAGTITGSGSLTFTSGTLTFSAGGGISGYSTLTTSALTISGSGTTDLSGLTSLDVNSTFTLSSPAALTAPPLFMAGGNFTISSGSTFTANNGTVVFDGTTGSNAIACNSASFFAVRFAHSGSNTKTVQNGCTLPVDTASPIAGNVTLQGVLSGSGTLTFSAGTLTLNATTSAFSGFSTVSAMHVSIGGGVAVNIGSLPSLDVNGNFNITTSGTSFTAPVSMSVAGNFTVATGTTFNHNNGTVSFDGEGSTYSAAAVTFYNFTMTASTGPRGMQFTGGNTITVAGALTLKGTAQHYVGLTSPSTTTWSIDPQGSRDVEYVSVAYANNINATAITAIHSLDNDHNTNWTFTDPQSSAGNTIDFEDTTVSTGLDAHMVGVYSHTAAWGDANGDGYLDLFVGTFTTSSRPDGETPAPSQLFLGNASGGFTKSDQAAIAVYGQASGAVFVDLDNDGDQDLVVSNLWSPGNPTPSRAEPHHLYENLGDGIYADISVASGITTEGPTSTGRTVSTIDYNHDGYMDLLMHADALVGGVATMRLLKNNGNLTFTNVTAAADLPTNISGLGVAIADANGDTYPDIVVSGGVYVSALSTDNFRDFYLYVNDGDGTFHDATPGNFSWPRQGTTHDDWTAGAAWGDLNNDGRMDLVQGQHFESTYRVSPLSLRIYMNTGNDSEGDPVFDLLPSDTLIPIAAKQPHMELQDFDNDGWIDIFTSNLTQVGSDYRPFVYRNTGTLDGSGNPSFTPPDYDFIPKVPGGYEIPYYAPGAPVADYDNDGKLDIFFCGLDVLAVPSIWRNNTSSTGRWLKVTVTSPRSKQGIGAVVKVYQAGHVSDPNYYLGMREIGTGSGFVSAGPTIAHFGLGTQQSVDIQVILANGEGTFTQVGVTTNGTVNLSPPQVLGVSTSTGTSPAAAPIVRTTTNVSTEASQAPSQPAPLDDAGTVLLDRIAGFTDSKPVVLEITPGQKLSYSLKIGNQSEEHTITLKEVGVDYVVVTFASTPTDVKIKLGETVQRDVNEDGRPDIEVKLSSLVDGVATLEIKKIAPAFATSSEGQSVSRAIGRAFRWVVIGGLLVVLWLVITRRRP